MKRFSILTLLMLLYACSLSFAQVDLSVNYTYTHPMQDMRTFIKQAHGLQMQGLYLIPNTKIALGADIGYHIYGTQTTRQTYRFSDGSTTQTNVRVVNSFSGFNLVGRLDLVASGTVIPYLMGKGGYQLYWTNLNIADPEDQDGCKPLENKALFTDGAFSVTGGGGLRLDMSSLFKALPKSRLFSDLSALYTQGGRVSYMNVNIPLTQDPQEHQHHVRTPAKDVTAYSARFINPTSRVIHEHHVGDVYTSYIRSVEFKLGIVYRIHR